MTTIDAGASPELATSMAQAVLASDTQRDLAQPPSAPPPHETAVALPGGYIDLIGGVLATKAEVRELNGEDEEAISRASNNLAKYFDTILARGVVSIGNRPADRELLDALLSGDRDALLVGIRCATFGDELEYNTVCPSCEMEQKAVVDLTRDLDYDTLVDAIDDREWDMALASGKKVKVGLPDGATSKALAAVEDRNEGVLNSVLLAKTVKEIDGFPVFGDDAVRTKLSIRDRREIIKEIGERNPGPKFGEVKRPCSSCGESIPLPISLVDLFLV